MISELKKLYDLEIYKFMSNLKLSAITKTFKKKIKFEGLKYRNFGELEFIYLSNQKAYYWVIKCGSDEFTDYCKSLKIPYPPNLDLSFGYHMFFSTVQDFYEEKKSLPLIKLYMSEDADEKIEGFNELESEFNHFYNPLINSFINFDLKLLEYIKIFPQRFSYPTVLEKFLLELHERD
ncbi:hypothetical protein KNO30_04865 [Taylorella equigenitalis]|nr:hypothetical protein [Taylorella equigenitalis]WDU47380.1 hypothetical protein KNO30_04865 [Taylorella equigenitalis]